LISNRTFYSHQQFLKNLKNALKVHGSPSILFKKEFCAENHLKLHCFFRHSFTTKLSSEVQTKKTTVFLTKIAKFPYNLVKIKNLNLEYSQTAHRFFHTKFWKFKNNLFSRRVEFFFDFILMTSLLIKGKMYVELYLFLLAEVFTILLKKKHGSFLFFIKTLLTTIMKLRKNPIVLQERKKKRFFKGRKKDYTCIIVKINGIKFWLSGKLKGKTRAKTAKMIFGKVPCQSVKHKIDYSKIHAYNRYGAFGFKLWINFKQ
jgi:hypothetical protein